MSCQPWVKRDASTRVMLLEGGQPSMRRGEQPSRDALGGKDGNVSSFHNLPDERMGRDGVREDLQDWKRTLGRSNM